MFQDIGKIIKKHPYFNVSLQNKKIIIQTKQILEKLNFDVNMILIEIKNSKIYLKTDNSLIKNQLFYNKNKIKKFLNKDIIVN